MLQPPQYPLFDREQIDPQRSTKHQHRSTQAFCFMLNKPFLSCSNDTRKALLIQPPASAPKQSSKYSTTPTCFDEVSKPGGHGSHRERAPDNGEHFLPTGRMYVPATATAVQPKPRQSRRPPLAPSGGRFSSQRYADSTPCD